MASSELIPPTEFRPDETTRERLAHLGIDIKPEAAKMPEEVLFQYIPIYCFS